MRMLTTNEQRHATISAAPTEVLSIPLHYARRWHLVITNQHGAQTLTALRIRRRLRPEGPVTGWEAIAAGLPVPASGFVSVFVTDDCAAELDIELTASGADTPVRIDLVGV